MKTFPIIFLILIATAIVAQPEEFQVVGSHFPPWMYRENGKPSGFYVELLHIMVGNMKDVEITIQFYPVPRMLEMISGSDNTFSLGITRSKKRERLYKWVGPIYPRIFALYKLTSRRELRIHTLEDVRPYKVGVGRGYAAVTDLLKAGIPRKNIEEVTEDFQNIRKLFTRRIDFIVANDMVFAYLLTQEGHHWGEAEQAIVLNDQYAFYYAFNKSFDDRIIRKFQQALDQTRQDGGYDALVKRYFPTRDETMAPH